MQKEALDENAKTGYKTSFSCINKNLEDIRPYMYLAGGCANTGKSVLLQKLGLDIAELNNCYVKYYSLDDDRQTTINRLIAMKFRMPINAVRYPLKYFRDQKEMLDKWNKAYNWIQSISNRFSVADLNTIGSTDIDDIVKDINITLEQIKVISDREQKQIGLTVIVDNFHDLGSRNFNSSNNENSRYQDCILKLNEVNTKHQIPILMSAEFKKANKISRPTMDLIRESVVTQYKTDCVMLCYNEVGMGFHSPSVYFERSGFKEPCPILEIKIAKSKVSSYKGTMFFKFFTEQSRIEECSEAECQQFIMNM
jgi:replicative DNA helicase